MKLLKQFFKGWNWFELLFLAAAIIVPVTVGIIFKSNPLEILASSTALIVAILFAKAKIEGYFLALISLSLYSVVAYQNKIYGEIIVAMGITIPLCIYGIFNWLRNKRNDNKKGRVVKIGRTGWVELSLLIVSQIAMGVGYYYMLRAFGTDYLLISAFSVTTVVIAAYLVARRSHLGLLGYVFNDITVIVLWALIVADKGTGSLVMLVMPCMYLVNDIYGTFSWRFLKKSQGPVEGGDAH
jgi:nicotinamide mononucleotide transporter